MEHPIKKDGFYSIDDIIDYKLVPQTQRTIQNYARKIGVRKIDATYMFTGYQVLEYQKLNERRAKKRAQKQEKEKLRLAQKADQEDIDLIKNNVTNIKESESADTFELSGEDFDKLQQTVMQNKVNQERVQTLTKRISEYQQEIEHYIDEIAQKNGQINVLLKSVNEHLANSRERNFIEAKEKGLDKKQ
tara:strand:- start:73 stop:639 length:567 start_codon:yes stop_codon:yes gene_type:complete